jgi:hypothetical protein
MQKNPERTKSNSVSKKYKWMKSTKLPIWEVKKRRSCYPRSVGREWYPMCKGISRDDCYRWSKIYLLGKKKVSRSITIVVVLGWNRNVEEKYAVISRRMKGWMIVEIWNVVVISRGSIWLWKTEINWSSSHKTKSQTKAKAFVWEVSQPITNKAINKVRNLSTMAKSKKNKKSSRSKNHHRGGRSGNRRSQELKYNNPNRDDRDVDKLSKDRYLRCSNRCYQS